MACNSDYLHPTELEEELQRAARLLVYVFQEAYPQTRVPPWIKRQAKDVYAKNKAVVPMLCNLVRNLNKQDKERIVYNGRSAKARDLADWWQRHLKADKQRKKEKRQEAEQEYEFDFTKKEILELKRCIHAMLPDAERLRDMGRRSTRLEALLEKLDVFG